MQLPPDPQLTTDRLLLRLVREDDLPDLLQGNGDDEVTRFLPYPSWTGMDDARAWLGRMQARRVDGIALQFVIVLRETGRVIGSALLFNFDEAAGRGEVGYLLVREHWRRGYMREALEALFAFAGEALALRELRAVIRRGNAASAGLVTSLGFEIDPLGEAEDCDTFTLALASPSAPGTR